MTPNYREFKLQVVGRSPLSSYAAMRSNNKMAYFSNLIEISPFKPHLSFIAAYIFSFQKINKVHFIIFRRSCRSAKIFP